MIQNNKKVRKYRKIQKTPKIGSISRNAARNAAIKVCSKYDIVQIKNPKSGLYVKIDRVKGLIISFKKSKGPYKNIHIVR